MSGLINSDRNHIEIAAADAVGLAKEDVGTQPYVLLLPLMGTPVSEALKNYLLRGSTLSYRELIANTVIC